MRSFGSITRVVFAAAVVLTLAACNVKQAYTDAAGPLAELIGGEYRAYAETAGDTRGAERAARFVVAVQAGEREQALTLWEDDTEQFIPGVKNAYVGYLDQDAELATPDGRRMYGICHRNVGRLDYIVRLHQPRAP